MELSAGYSLNNRYVIEEKLGSGGMGTVYLAMDEALSSKVAIKSNLSLDGESGEQFLKEAQVLAGLRHPNLPRVTDYFVLEDSQYLVMDYVPGEDLSARMKRLGIQPVTEVLHWARQLASALDYMHSLNPPVIHRDIKPGNIKLKPDGTALLVDFGLVKSSESNLTLTGARGFTPGYAPPEQYGSGQTGPYSDQYSLAATMYAMLTGAAPPEAVRRMMEEVRLVPAHEMNPKVPHHVSEALNCAMSLMPQNRFSSMKEFMNALQNPNFTGPTRVSASNIVEEAANRRRLPGWLLPVGLGAAGLLVVIILGIGLIGGGLLMRNNGSDNDQENQNEPTAAVVEVVSTTQTAITEIPMASATLTLEPSSTPEPTLTATPSPTVTMTYSPSPEPTLIGRGGLIAFVSNRTDDGTYQIFTMKPDGSDVTQITFDGGDKSQPCWSPDGTELLFVANGGGGLGLEIYWTNFSAALPLNLTNSAGDDFDPAWSPDGTKIAFTSERVNNLRQVFVMNADGSDQQFWSRGYAVEFDPFWSPDGTVLAVVASINDAPGEIFLRTGEGEENTERFDVQKRLGGVNDIAWSPDGVYIAYSMEKSGSKEIALVEFDSKGTIIYQLTHSLNNKEPDWSPDGEWIVFTSTSQQNAEIYIMDRAGGQLTNLTNSEYDDIEPAWQPLATE